MINFYAEVTCDQCGQADFAFHGQKNERFRRTAVQMRENGWIFTAARKHFCGKDCYSRFRSLFVRSPQSPNAGS